SGDGSVAPWGRAKASSLLPTGDCQRPPRFAFAEPPTPLEESYPVGTSLRYRCRPGYTLAGGSSPLVTCLNTSLWHANPDFCVVKSCRPPDIMNGNFNYTTDLLLGTTIIYTCDTGYRLVGQQTARCVLENNEVFWDNTPYCDIIPCSPPPVIENAQSSAGNQDFTFGMAVTYRCNTGFSRIGDPTIHCTVNEDLEGVWSGPPPECKVVRCKNPEVKNGRKLSGFGTEYTYRDTVTFECYPGYLLNGSSVVTCGADNTWNPPVPTCDLIHCGPAPRFPFAEPERPVGESSPAGTQLRYMCKAGYAAAGSKSSVVTCLNDATWSAEPDFCIRQQCTRPMIKNGDVIADNFQFETVVTFTCHPGYELKESFSAKCVVSGNGVDWDTPLPHCERQRPDALCKEPPAIDNGMHNGTKGTDFVHGSVVVYKCKDGFTLAGVGVLRCIARDQYQGAWSKPLPECRGDYLLCLSCCLLSVFKIPNF
ncbi:CR1L protein, partial [Rhynochetos jubatus]|nr:CR1L protein [Rhynochetos jubatus]